MLGAKTVFFAVIAMLAIVETQAETAAHLRVRMHAKESNDSKGSCTNGQQSVVVDGWSESGCVNSGNVCSANATHGDCPPGAYCSSLTTGEHGCVGAGRSHERHHKTLAKSALSKSAVTCPSGEQSVVVDGWSQDGCVATGNVCAAKTDGDCPSGAHCEKLGSGDFGCQDGPDKDSK